MSCLDCGKRTRGEYEFCYDCGRRIVKVAHYGRCSRTEKSISIKIESGPNGRAVFLPTSQVEEVSDRLLEAPRWLQHKRGLPEAVEFSDYDDRLFAFRERRKDSYAHFTRRAYRKFHQDFKGFTCSRCGATFDEKKRLHLHKRNYCEPKEKPYKPDQLELDLK